MCRCKNLPKYTFPTNFTVFNYNSIKLLLKWGMKKKNPLTNIAKMIQHRNTRSSWKRKTKGNNSRITFWNSKFENIYKRTYHILTLFVQHLEKLLLFKEKWKMLCKSVETEQLFHGKRKLKLASDCLRGLRGDSLSWGGSINRSQEQNKMNQKFYFQPKWPSRIKGTQY